MDIAPLKALDNGGFEGLGIGEVRDADGRVTETGQMGGAVPSGSCHDFVRLLAEWTYEERREDALGAGARGKLLESILFEGAARVDGGLDQAFERQVAVFALNRNRLSEKRHYRAYGHNKFA